MKRTLRINTADSTVETPGVDYGTRPVVVALNRRAGMLVMKVDGGKVWSGLGQQSYAPARFYTFQIHMPETVDWSREVVVVNATSVLDHPVRATALDLTPRVRA